MKNLSIEPFDENIRNKGLTAIIDFYRTLSVAELRLHTALGFVTGVNDPFLNVLFDRRDKIINTKEIADVASAFFDKHKIPWCWFITPAIKENDLAQYGFVLLEEAPAMYFSLSNELPNYHSLNINIKDVTEDKTLKEWIEPINEAFKVKEGDESYRKLNESVLKRNKSKFRHYVAYYQDKLAGAATLFLTDDAVMLHNLATKQSSKNHGVGTALTLHMMDVAKTLGYKDCYLDSSAEAFSLYKKLGFKTYSSTLIYSKIQR